MTLGRCTSPLAIAHHREDLSFTDLWMRCLWHLSSAVTGWPEVTPHRDWIRLGQSRVVTQGIACAPMTRALEAELVCGKAVEL